MFGRGTKGKRLAFDVVGLQAPAGFRHGPSRQLHDPEVNSLDRAPAYPPPPEEMVKVRMVRGLDLGQASDHTALAGIAQKVYHAEYDQWVAREVAALKDERERAELLKARARQHKKKLVDLMRWPLKTSYLDIVDKTLALPTKAGDMLIVDMGGPGRPVLDLLRAKAQETGYLARIVGVAIVGSSAAMQQHKEARGVHWSVPKIDLVSAAVVMMQAEEIVLPKGGAVQLLKSEMTNFQTKQTSKGNMQFEARSGKHDDIVLAFSLAAWWVSRFGNRQLNFYAGK